MDEPIIKDKSLLEDIEENYQTATKPANLNEIVDNTSTLTLQPFQLKT
jgi:hypothetical protein